MLIPIYIPILVTILGIIYLFTIDRWTDFIPVIGWMDTPIVLLVIVGIWLAYAVNKAIEQAWADVMTGNIATIIMIALVIFVGYLYYKHKKK